ncbi:MAG: PKD domain containing protein, partial [Marmoricola sp.]
MRRTAVSALATLLGVIGLLLAPTTPLAQAVDSPQGRLVAAAPAAGTPHVLNGAVASIAQVGDQMVLGGSFTTARNDNSQTQLTRNRLLAFNANTGLISTTFLPNPNGSITTVIPAGDGATVYVAGSFSSIGGVARTNVARVRVSDGAVVTEFNAGSVTGQVKDLRLSNGRLWLAGAFTHVGGRAQRALATVNATTGAFDTYMRLTLAGVHNGSYTAVAKIDISPNGSRLVAIGNFDTLNTVKNHQMLVLDLAGAAAAPADFRTSFYETPCSPNFDSYMRDLDFSPDGSFFAVTTTGAYGGSEGACDTTARWETGSTGAGIRPSWVDYTGGDTTYAVLITDSVVYTGGHARWQNNPFAGDRAGPGAVSRPGIAALDPINGLPLSWNPTRTRGVGVFDFLLTSRGLWVGSDTDRIGSFVYKGRIALMPLDGAVIPAVKTPTLPNDIYVGGRQLPAPDTAITKRSYNAGTVGASTAVPNGGIDWNQVRGAFMLNGQVY